MKQPLNEQFRRMQKLAGIITESNDSEKSKSAEPSAEEILRSVGLEVPDHMTPEQEQFILHMYRNSKKVEERMEGGIQYDILQNGEGGEDFFQDKEEIVQYFERRGILNFELEDGEQISVEDGVDRMMNGETLVVTNEELVEMGDDYAEWSVEEV